MGSQTLLKRKAAGISVPFLFSVSLSNRVLDNLKEQTRFKKLGEFGVKKILIEEFEMVQL